MAEPDAEPTGALEVLAGPPSLAGLAKAVAGLLLLGALLRTSDPVFRVLLVPAGAFLLGLGLRDLVLRPALRATASSVTVVSGLRHVTAGWDEVERLRVVTDRRAPLLEVDLGHTLVVLSRARLGQHPYQVLEQLEELRPR